MSRVVLNHPVLWSEHELLVHVINCMEVFVKPSLEDIKVNIEEKGYEATIFDVLTANSELSNFTSSIIIAALITMLIEREMEINYSEKTKGIIELASKIKTLADGDDIDTNELIKILMSNRKSSGL